MSWKVLITTKAMGDVGQTGLDLLREKGCQLQLPPQFGPKKGAELLSLLKGADAVLADLDHYTAQVFQSEAAGNLKIISRWGVGYDSIDIAAATAAGVAVAYTPGLLDETVADLAFGLILSVARRVHEGHLSMRNGEWKKAWSYNVHGKNLGIIGCGRIGRAIGRRAKGFDMKLLGYDPFPNEEAKQLGIEFVALDELLTRSDFVSLHAAATPETRGMIDENAFARMKPTAFLINTARGALVDESALIRALETQKIAGAALDAFVEEPLPADHRFRCLPNLLLSPHQASYTRETGEKVSLRAAQSIVELWEGKEPKFLVNPEVLKTSQFRAQSHS